MKISEMLKALRSDVLLTNEDQAVLLDKAVEMIESKEYQDERDAEREKNLEGAREQALAQMSSIAEMVAALNCDYDRLEELRDERDSLQSDIKEECDPDCACRFVSSAECTCGRVDANSALSDWQAANSEELAELEDAAGDCESQDDASERIQEDPLDISVRSDWQNIGETLTPSEFTILLCTGGPACRIVGELDQYNHPSRARLEYQDWFTPWTELVDVSHSDLLTYCQQFYFGE